MNPGLCLVSYLCLSFSSTQHVNKHSFLDFPVLSDSSLALEGVSKKVVQTLEWEAHEHLCVTTGFATSPPYLNSVKPWQPILRNCPCYRTVLFHFFCLSSCHKIPFWNLSVKLLVKFTKQRFWNSLAWSSVSTGWFSHLLTSRIVLVDFLIS